MSQPSLEATFSVYLSSLLVLVAVKFWSLRIHIALSVSLRGILIQSTVLPEIESAHDRSPNKFSHEGV